ncbi:MAG: radical SAM protein [Candidatus Bathyarchaeia archaeon]
MLRAEPQYYGTYLAFDHVKERTQFLNEDEFKILQYLRGKVADVEDVARNTGISYDKCAKFLKRAFKLELVVKNDHVPEDLPSRSMVNHSFFARFPIPFLSAPTSVDVFITSRCNLKCVHCFSATREAIDLPLQTLMSIFNQLEEMGVLEVRINGGEPLMHPNIGEVLEVLSSKMFRKVILTNGTMLDDEMAIRIKRSNVIPTVSLDDSDADDNDSFRGVKGAFIKTVEGLKILQKNKVQYGINCCIHAKNLNRIEKIVKFAEDLGACRIAFLDLKPIGRMQNHREWVPSHVEYEASMAQMMIAKLKHRRIDVSLDAFLRCTVIRESIIEAKRGYISCKAGRTTLSVFSDCSVYPCNTVLGDPKWKMGNLKNEKLMDVWFSKNWNFFRGGVRINDLKKCRDCREMRSCKDIYCRLLPYAVTGDPFGPSPRCSSI